MKKKSILYIFIFIIGLCLIDNVNADQGCSYKQTVPIYDAQKYYDAIKGGGALPKPLVMGNVHIEITLNEKGKLSISSLDNPFNDVPDKYISGLFIVDNNTLYCPNEVYLNKEFDGYFTATKSSLAANPRPNTDVTETSGPVSYTLTNPEAVNGAKVYTPQKSGSTLIACKTGGAGAANYIKNTANDYKNKANDASLTSLLNLQEELKRLSTSLSSELNKQYCEVAEFKNASKSIEEANSVIAKKIAANSRGDAFKDISKENQDAISSEIENVNEIIASKVNQITIKEGNILNCEELLDKDLKDVIKWVLKIVRIAVPILLIVLVTIDFSSAVISQDQDSIKKATSKAIKRGIAALAFFFVPLFVNVMLDWLLKYSPITVTKTNEAGETVKVEMRDISCEEVLKGDSDI